MMRVTWILIFIMYVVTSHSQEQTMGLFYNLPSSYNGYTLFSNNESTYLIDNCGLIVNQWKSKYGTFGSVTLLDDGSLLRLVNIENSDFRAGGSAGRFELFSWDDELLWYYEISDKQQISHHDIEILPNGNILTLVWQKITEGEALDMGRNHNGELWIERIVEIERRDNNQANIVWEWTVQDHLVQDQYPDRNNFGNISDNPSKIDFNYSAIGSENNRDWLHINSLDYNANLDQLAISAKHMNEVWIIDHSTTTAQAASSEGGRWGKGGDLLYRYGNPAAYHRIGEPVLNGQHSVSWVSDTQLMVFNNNYNEDNSRSSVEIWTLPITSLGEYTLDSTMPYGPFEVDYRYTESGFYSPILSSAQQLPNGNILICEGLEGKFFEIDQDGIKQWSYINPVNGRGGPGIQGGQPRQNSIFKVQRYGPDFSGFIDKSLTPTLPVELSPFESTCTIHQTSSTEEPIVHLEFLIYPNPSQEYISIKTPFTEPRSAQIYNSNGQLMTSITNIDNSNTINVSAYPPGHYFIKLMSNSHTYCSRFIKM